MKRNIDDIYLSIAEHIVKNIDNWKSAKLLVKMYKDNAIFDATYITIENEEKDFNVEYELFEDFQDLYKIMTEKTDVHKWNKAIFTLDSDGNFSINFEWDESLTDEMY